MAGRNYTPVAGADASMNSPKATMPMAYLQRCVTASLPPQPEGDEYFKCLNTADFKILNGLVELPAIAFL